MEYLNRTFGFQCNVLNTIAVYQVASNQHNSYSSFNIYCWGKNLNCEVRTEGDMKAMGTM